MKSYKTLHERASDEFVVEKSVFIGHAMPVKTEEEARAFVDEMKHKYKDATHNVWAYTIGESMNIQRFSDDGEPQGTAGIPTLEVIKKEDLRNVVVVVTRYFGGVKLGAGGLVRAYTKGAKIGLEAAKIVEKNPFTQVDISLDYTLLGKMQNELANRNFTTKDVEYTDNVKFIIYCEQERLGELKSLATEISSANAIIEEKEEFYLSVVDGKILF